jgi:hypothetical protein
MVPDITGAQDSSGRLFGRRGVHGMYASSFKIL